MIDEYTCALSGVTEDGHDVNHKEVGTLPDGWVQIIVRRRILNPRFLEIQQVKEGLVQSNLKDLPPEHLEIQEMVTRNLIDAQFAALEASVPESLVETSEVFVSDPDANPDVKTALDNILRELDIEPFDSDEDDEDEGEDDEGEEEEE